LNKDDPSRPGFDQARALAVTASEDFLAQILDDPSVAGNARAIKALMASPAPGRSRSSSTTRAPWRRSWVS
jgi:hypothetical protein